MQTKRKRYSAQFKSQVALEALKEQKTLTELSGEYGIHSNQISLWKKQLLEEAELYRQIGQLKVELDWLKKKVPGKDE